MTLNSATSISIMVMGSSAKFCCFPDVTIKKRYALTALWATMLVPSLYIVKEYVLNYNIESNLTLRDKSKSKAVKCTDMYAPFLVLVSDNVYTNFVMLLLFVANALALVGAYKQRRGVILPFIVGASATIIYLIVYVAVTVIYADKFYCESTLIYLCCITYFLIALYGYCICLTFKLYKSFKPNPKRWPAPDALVEAPQLVEVPLPQCCPSPDMVFSKLREKYDPHIVETKNIPDIEGSV